MSSLPPEQPSLRDATLSGVKWTSAARLVAELCALVSSVVLARLIVPAEFGLTVVAMFVATLAQSVASQGIGTFLVHLEAPSAHHYRTAMTLSIAAGLIGSVLTAAFALLAAPALFGDRAAELLLIASPVAAFGSLSSVPMSALSRRLDFRRVAMVEASMALTAPLVSVGFALAGLEGEAIIFGLLTSVAVGALLAFTFSRPPRPGWSPGEMRQIVGYAAPATGSSVLYSAVRNIDYVILAAWLPAAQVGYYLRGFLLGSDYQSKISGILLRVAFPVLSRSRDRGELRRVRARMVRVHAALIFPLLFCLIAVAPDLVPWLYGPNWAPAAPLAQILALGGMVAAVGTGTGPLLLATGHPKALFAYNLVGFVAYSAAVLVAVQFGLLAVCWAVVGVRLVSFVLLQYLVVDRIVGIPLLETLRDDALPALSAGIVLLGVAWGAVEGLHAISAPAAVVVIAASLAGLVAYALVVRLAFADTWHDLVMLSRSVTRRAPRAGRVPLRVRLGRGPA